MAQALIYFLHLESELRVAEDTGMFYCVLVSINIPFEPLDQILFHMNFKQKAFGINTWLLCFIFLSQFQIYNITFDHKQEPLQEHWM